jgi:hypothetical protein
MGERQLVDKPPQRLNIIHVVPRRKLGQLQADLSRACPCLLRDPRRAPGNIGEKMRVRAAGTQQIVAAVLRRAEHDAVPARQQQRGGAAQIGGGQSRAVGVEQARRGETARKARLKRVTQGAADALDARGHGHAAVGEHQRGALGQHSGELRRGIGGRVRDAAPDRHVTRGKGDVLGDVAEECRAERGGLLGSQRRDEPRLGAARLRRLRHDADRAGARAA